MADLTPQGHALGLVFGPKDPRTWAFAFTPMAAPPQDIDWRPRLRPVGNQGSIGSCTGWGFTAAMEAARQDSQQRSPLYVYYRDRIEDGQNPPRQDTGATMLAACKAVQKYGAPTDADWPYDPNRYNVAPTAAADAAASACRADSYYQVQGAGFMLLQGIWAALREGPCPIALQVYESFEANVGSNGKVPMPTSRERVLGGHCICACGWFNDNSAPGGYGYVVCQNSWGEAMGQDGYYFLPAGYFTAGIVVEAWVVKLAAVAPPEPEEEVDPAIYDEIQQALVEASAITGNLDTARYQLRDSDPNTAWTYVGEGSRIQGSQAQRLRRVLELLPPKGDEPGPVDPPTPAPVTTLMGFGGSYAQHDPAKDIYLGTDPDMAAWGRHWGHDVLAPAAGTVNVYTFPTPLSAPVGLGGNVPPLAVAEYYQNHADLFRGITGPGGCYYGAQTMYFALLTFDTPQRLRNGQMVKAIWIGHCRGDIAAGRVNAGDRWCTTYDSGIRFENNGIQARASHAHTCGTVSGALTMNGEVDGFLVAELLGWQVQNVGTIPGPNDYLSGQYIAGKSRAVWGNRALPPMPS